MYSVCIYCMSISLSLSISPFFTHSTHTVCMMHLYSAKYTVCRLCIMIPYLFGTVSIILCFFFAQSFATCLFPHKFCIPTVQNVTRSCLSKEHSTTSLFSTLNSCRPGLRNRQNVRVRSLHIPAACSGEY